MYGHWDEGVEGENKDTGRSSTRRNLVSHICRIGDLMLYEINKDLDTVRHGLDTVRQNMVLDTVRQSLDTVRNIKGFVDFTKDQGVVSNSKKQASPNIQVET